MLCDVVLYVFFFKQKTAYEMRISDWSSDVCSSDLPERTTSDVVNSLIASREHSPHGILPVWQFAGRETWTMIGYHAVPVIADAYLKGIRGFDADKALAAMVASADHAPYGGLGDYMKLRTEERRVGKGCVSTWRMQGG